MGASAGTWPTLNGQRPLILGHRGATAYRPEETAASYELAIELGADYIEPDLVSTSDGVLIARHEPNITETTDVASRAAFASRRTEKLVDGAVQAGWFADDFTLAEIKTLRARERLPFRDHSFDGRFEVLTFQEVIDIAARGTVRTGRTIGIIPETKHPSYFRSIGLPLERGLVETLTANGLTGRTAPVIIQSFEVGNLKELRALTDVRLVQLTGAHNLRPADFLCNGDARTYADLLAPDGLIEIATYADAIGPSKRSIVSLGPGPASAGGRAPRSVGSGARPLTDAEQCTAPPSRLVADAHAAGLMVLPYTFRDESVFLAADYGGDPVNEYLQFYRLGVDGVFTDAADTAFRARGLAFP